MKISDVKATIQAFRDKLQREEAVADVHQYEQLLDTLMQEIAKHEGTPEDQKAWEAVRLEAVAMHGNDDVDIDDSGIVSEGQGECWVQAWVRVPMEPATEEQVCAAGYDGSNDETDDRVFWVVAPSRQIVDSTIGDIKVHSVQRMDQKVVEPDFRLPACVEEMRNALAAFAVN